MSDIDNILQSKSNKELGGKLIGQHTKVLESSLRGETKPSWWNRLYATVIYDSRPNTTSKETRSEQWGKLHSPYRYLHSLFLYLGPPGYFLYNLRVPMTLVTVVILLNAVYSTLYIFLDDKFPSIPTFRTMQTWDIFRMGSFSLSLLLSVKISKVYDRFWSARSSFGKISGNLNMLMQLMALYSRTDAPEGMSEKEASELLDMLSAWMTVYPYALTMQLLTLSRLPREVVPLIRYEEVDLLESTAKPRKFVLMKLQSIVHQFKLPMEKYLCVQNLLQDTETSAATCRRIKFTALPYNISQVCTGFVLIWLCVVPFGMQETVDAVKRSNVTKADQIVGTWIEAVLIFFFSLMMLCTDEVANQLEDPFHSLPLFDSLKTAMAHLATVKEDFEKIDFAAMTS
eukprot:jgi/Picsp_1/3672/NSC_06509-R1_upf0187-domain-containing protein